MRYIRVAVLSSALLALTATASLAQSPDTTTYPEPVLGIRLGAGRQATMNALVARGWSLVADTIRAVGKPALYAGNVDGHRAEIVAMFSENPSRDRLIHVAINFPVEDEAALAATYAWAYRRMERSRCAADLQAGHRAQLDSILRRGDAAVPIADRVPRRTPILPGHTTVDPGNMNWPTPIWVTAEGLAGTRLDAALLHKESPWPFQVTLWTSPAFTIEDDATLCADTKALIERGKPGRVE